jgi:PQQ-dependent dehydrogenase (s-GDH family)
MWRIPVAFLFLVAFCNSEKEPETVAGPKGESFVRRVVADQLSDPWEITFGPDNYLWVTEAKGYRVSRINPSDGSRKVLLDLNNAKNFIRYDQVKAGDNKEKPWPQGGLMGLAIHPQLLKGKPYVYLSYVYNFAGANAEGKGCEEKFGGCFYTTRIVRYSYDARRDTLVAPEILCDTIPGSSDHNGGRLLVAPVGTQQYVFYAIGEMGAGQFDNGGRTNHAQDINYYEGKILRFHTEPDSDTTGFDKWVPNDNPFNSQKQNAVWTSGHRNPQGLAYYGGKIYASEHGPYSDDEVNLIEKGKNYGHPLIEGYNDGNYNGLAAGASSHKELPGIWHTTYPTIINEQANASAIGADYRNPIKSFYPTPNNTLQNILSQTREGEKIDWISEAPSSLDVYTSAAIPGWQNSLLMPTLKTGQVIRLQLNSGGDGITGDTLVYFKEEVARYRDLAISPDGRKIYLAVDSSTKSSGPTEGKKKKSFCRGCIVEFSFTQVQSKQ